MSLSLMTKKNWWLSSESLYFNQSVGGGGGFKYSQGKKYTLFEF